MLLLLLLTLSVPLSFDFINCLANGERSHVELGRRGVNHMDAAPINRKVWRVLPYSHDPVVDFMEHLSLRGQHLQEFLAARYLCHHDSGAFLRYPEARCRHFRHALPDVVNPDDLTGGDFCAVGTHQVLIAFFLKFEVVAIFPHYVIVFVFVTKIGNAIKKIKDARQKSTLILWSEQ